jgi:hypothetical protein
MFYSIEEIKNDCLNNPTEFNQGYIQALYDEGLIDIIIYDELNDIIDNSPYNRIS